MLPKLIGEYQIHKNTLKGAENQYLICKRKQPTSRKPTYYLLEQIGKKTRYISSLYQKAGVNLECVDQYELEYNRKYYLLTINNCKSSASINSTYTINNVELV
jgi:hypothetical protein